MSGNLPKAKRVGGTNMSVVWILAGLAIVLAVVLAFVLLNSQLFSRDAQTDADRDYILLVEGAKEKPKDPVVQMSLAEAEYRLGKRDEGLERAKLAVKLGGEQPGFRTRYAMLLVQSDQLEEAKSVLTEDTKLNGDKDAEPHFLLAQVLSDLKEDQLAVETMESGLKLNPNAADMRVIYGRLLESVDRTDEAIAQYQIVLKFLPGDPAATEALRRLGVTIEEPTSTVAPHGGTAPSTDGGAQ